MQFKWLIVLAITACLLLTVEAHEKKVKKPKLNIFSRK